MHAVPGAFGQHRFISGRGGIRGGRRRSSCGDRRLQHLAPERLRRLREENLFTWQGLDDDAATGRHDPLHGIAHRQRGDRCAVRDGAFDRARDDVARDKRPRRIVDEDDVDRLGHGGERIGHRILSAFSASDQTDVARAIEPCKT